MLSRVTTYCLSPAALTLLILSRQWRSQPVPDAVLMWTLLLAFPVACLLDFIFRGRSAPPPALFWLLRAISFACWLFIIAGIYAGMHLPTPN